MNFQSVSLVGSMALRCIVIVQLILAASVIVFGQSLTSDASVIDAYLGGRCRPEQQVFVLQSGLIQVSPSDTLATLPHSLHLADCVARCARHAHCRALNFETGLCVLLNRTQPSLLSAANFPVFTLHAQKRCLPTRPDSLGQCRSAWALDTLAGRRLRAPLARLAPSQRSALDCAARCLEEKAFACRAVNFRPSDGRCELLRVDRHSLADSVQGDSLQTDARWMHIQNACATRPTGICRFRRLRGRLLKTVDALYEHITDEPSCRQLCLQSGTPCRSYTLGHPNNRACRLSHLSTYTASHIIEPWMQTPGADTFELTACYNVSVSCDSKEMIAQVSTDRQFSGKLYAKGKPQSCVNDVKRMMDFELRLPYDDPRCEVQKSNESRFSKDIVIQHHDLILTTKDIGLSLHCSYDLTNRTVQNSIRFDPDSEGKEELDDRLVHSSFVYSPNVTIQIKDTNGLDVQTARVGDPLTLRFVMDDENTPYEIFIHDLVASDGTSDNEITLIDSNGCPTEPAILGAIKRRQVRKDSSKDDSDTDQWQTDDNVPPTTNEPEVLEADAQRPARLQIDQQGSTTSVGTTIFTSTPVATSALTESNSESGLASVKDEEVTTTVDAATSTESSETSTATDRGSSNADDVTSRSDINRISSSTESFGSITTTTTTTSSSTIQSTVGAGSTVTLDGGKLAAKSGGRSPTKTAASDEPVLRSKQLEATFEAFKFPTTNLVQFRAVITPCLGECASVRCALPSVDGGRKTIQSFGRRRRRSVKTNGITQEPMIVMQSIQITEKHEPGHQSSASGKARVTPAIGSSRLMDRWTNCVTAGGLGLIVGLLLFGQIAVIAMWWHLRAHWRQWRHHSWTPHTAKHAITTVAVPDRF